MKILLWLTLFSIAMGYLESAVVVYLREIFYKGGFSFPLAPIDKATAVTEFWREVATIVMLAAAGILSGQNRLQRFMFFLYSFGIWDIFYYVFLKVLINWPSTIMEWDILFLIPVPWLGPVLAPCIVSASMITLCLITVYFQTEGLKVEFTKVEKWLMVAGCLIIFISFIWNYAVFLYTTNIYSGIWTIRSSGNLFHEITGYIPEEFNWPLFIAGEVILITGVLAAAKRLSLMFKRIRP